MVDISGQVDTSLIVDGQPIDAADVTTPIDDLTGLINNILNGNQDFDQLAFNQATTITISASTLNCVQTLHTVAAQTGTADDIDTIVADNDTFVVLRADAGDTITLKHGLSNITTFSGDDVVLSGNKAVLVFVQGGQAAVIGGGAGGGVDFGTASELTIASGAVTRTAYHHTIDTESDAASDDLDTINASGATAGRALIIRPAHTDRTVVVKHGTGNIYLNGGVDFSMDSTEKLTLLIYDGTNWLGVGVPITSGAGSGTVTSVGMSVPAWLNVAGSPVTTSGTLAVSAASGQTANRVLASPDGSTGAVSLRALVADDLPTVPIGSGGTGQTTQAAGFDALAPTTTEGDLVYRGASNNARLAIGTTGQVLTVSGGVPAWSTPSSGSGAADAYTANQVSDYTTSSTTFADVDGTNFNLSVSTNGGDVLIGFYGNVKVSGSGAPTVYFDVLQDAARVAGDDGLMFSLVGSTDTVFDQYQPVSFVYLVTGLSAATYAFKLQWKVSTAAVILYAGAGTASLDVHPQFWVKEV